MHLNFECNHLLGSINTDTQIKGFQSQVHKKTSWKVLTYQVYLFKNVHTNMIIQFRNGYWA